MSSYKKYLTETSGEYHGVLVLMSDSERNSFMLGHGFSSGKKPPYIGYTSDGVFIDKEGWKSVNRYLKKRFSVIPGTFDFSIDQFFKRGIRGVK
jgi:hypothetical protein